MRAPLALPGGRLDAQGGTPIPIRDLTAELDAGTITQAEYDRLTATLRETGWRSVFTLAMGFVFRRERGPVRRLPNNGGRRCV